MASADQKLDRIIDRLSDEFKIPGLVLGVFEDGDLASWRCRGKVSLTHDVETSIDSVFQLASVTKQFTGAALALAAERYERTFKLDDKLIQHLPPRYSAQAPLAWSNITVRHLLHHTSGLPNRFESAAGADPDAGDFHSWRMAYSADRLFDGAKDEVPKFEPGTDFSYSDTGYFLLGLVIKAVTGKEFRDFVDESLFRPLGMRSTRMVDRRRVMKKMASAYRWDSDIRENVRDRLREVREEVKSHYGAISTILDLARWEAELNDPQILSKKSVKAMFTPHDECKGYPVHPEGFRWGYGFGWFWTKLGGQAILSHSGITGTYYMRIPDKKISLVLLTNQSRLADNGALLPKLGLEIMDKYQPGALDPAWQDYLPGLVRHELRRWS
ncbi:MAG: serine hydrolase domain-containing protein [Geminicoccaceae bacterium]